MPVRVRWRSKQSAPASWAVCNSGAPRQPEAERLPRRCKGRLRCRAKLCLGHTQLSQGWLAGAREADKGAPKPLSFWGVLAMAPTSREATSPALRAACLASVLEIVRQQLVTIKAHAAPALEACMGPVQRALAAVAAHGDASRALRQAAREVAEEAAAAVAATIAARRPMTCAALTKKAPQRLLNPKFEVDFDKRRDYDPDRERADYREYKRLAAKENRCAPPPTRGFHAPAATLVFYVALSLSCGLQPCALGRVDRCISVLFMSLHAWRRLRGLRTHHAPPIIPAPSAVSRGCR